MLLEGHVILSNTKIVKICYYYCLILRWLLYPKPVTAKPSFCPGACVYLYFKYVIQDISVKDCLM